MSPISSYHENLLAIPSPLVLYHQNIISHRYFRNLENKVSSRAFNIENTYLSRICYIFTHALSSCLNSSAKKFCYGKGRIVNQLN